MSPFDYLTRPETPDTAGTPFSAPLDWRSAAKEYRNVLAKDEPWSQAEGSPWAPGPTQKWIANVLMSEPAQGVLNMSNFLGPPMGRLAPRPTVAPARSIDPLGYYSQALEVAKSLPQAKGTPEQMLAMLRKGGVKEAEITATDLANFLKDRPSVTRDEIAGHLEGNRVGLKEVVREAPLPRNVDAVAMQEYRRPYANLSAEEQADVMDVVLDRGLSGVRNPAKWQSNSLDPSNPSYRETVLHLPRRLSFDEYLKAWRKHVPNSDATAAEVRGFYDAGTNIPGVTNEPPSFTSDHFSEPNIVGHMMTSMVKDKAGKPVYLIDQIQSDWGQKLRNGGVRDEAKIAELKRHSDEAHARMKGILDKVRDEHAKSGSLKSVVEWLNETGRTAEARALSNAVSESSRIGAEYRTAEAASPGHPLVNTTDQWTNTTLRRAIRQAIDAGAEQIAIPSGKTVLSYNPGGEHGMAEFYDKIVPKNLQNILSKIDKGQPRPAIADVLMTPGRGEAGNGFTVFPLSQTVKDAVRDNGLPLFGLAAASLGATAAGWDGQSGNALAQSGRSPLSALRPRPTMAPEGTVGIRAYHGSPHDFDAFQTPAFFSRDEGTARAYRNFGGSSERLNGLRQDVPDGYYPAARIVDENGGDRNAAIRELEGLVRRDSARKPTERSFLGKVFGRNADRPPSEFEKDQAERAQKSVDYLKAGGSTGKIYEVALPEPTKNYPGKNQTQEINEAIRDGHKVISFDDGREIVALNAEVIKILRKYGLAGLLAGGAAATQGQEAKASP